MQHLHTGRDAFEAVGDAIQLIIDKNDAMLHLLVSLPPPLRIPLALGGLRSEFGDGGEGGLGLGCGLAVDQHCITYHLYVPNRTDALCSLHPLV